MGGLRRSYQGSSNPNWRGGRCEIVCKRCGSLFSVIPSRADKAAFCSRSCFIEHEREIKPDWNGLKYGVNVVRKAGKGKRRVQYVQIACRQCSAVFEIPPGRVGLKVFCSVKCQMAWRSSTHGKQGNPNWRGGISRHPYHFNWHVVRKSVVDRDQGKCQNPSCYGERGQLDVHHIDYNKSNCDPFNLIALCDSCNSRANFNRSWWLNYYRSLQESRGLVSVTDGSSAPFVPDRPGRKGSRHHLAKLSECDATEIVRLKRSGVKGRRIAEQYHVSEATISNIVRGKNWTHVTDVEVRS